MMKTLNIFARSLVAYTITASLGAIALITPAHAQNAGEVDPLEDFQTNDNGSDIFGSGGADSTDVFNLIHNLMLNNGTPLDQFNRQRSENITTEAESFREAQMQEIQFQETDSAIEPAPLPAE